MADPTSNLNHDTWLTSDRPVPRNFVRPLLRFTSIEAAGGIVLLIGAVAALVWANLPSGESYARFWETPLALEIAPNQASGESPGYLDLDHVRVSVVTE